MLSAPVQRAAAENAKLRLDADHQREQARKSEQSVAALRKIQEFVPALELSTSLTHCQWPAIAHRRVRRVDGSEAGRGCTKPRNCPASESDTRQCEEKPGGIVCRVRECIVMMARGKTHWLRMGLRPCSLIFFASAAFHSGLIVLAWG